MSNQADFASCETRDEARELLDALMREPLRIKSAQVKLMREYRRAHDRRCREIRQRELEPLHDECRRWRHGQKVYFAKADNLSWMSFDSLKVTQVYDVKAGDWCRVWKYQPRKRIAWFCQPRKKLAWENVIDRPFTLDKLDRLGVSRTEPSIRAKHS